MTVLSIIDFAIIAVILLLAFDALRKVTFFQEPILTMIFVMACCGSFGMLLWKISENHPDTHWWALCLHTSIALYAMRMSGRSVALFRLLDAARMDRYGRRAK